MARKRIMASALVAAMLVTSSPATLAVGQKVTKPPAPTATVSFTQFRDVGSHWAKDSLQWGVQNGVITGTSETTISPDGMVSRAQLAAMITRAFGATKEANIGMFIDVDKDAWYYSAIARAVQMGCFSGFGNAASPERNVTRQEVAVMLVKAAGYPLVNEGALNKFKDVGQVDTWARPYMATAIHHGLLTGYSDGRCAPRDMITRAQFVTMLKRLAIGYMTPTATYTEKTVNGSLMVGIGGISLDNMTINGNLFLSDGVGQGDITLNGTTVTGSVIVRGTGPNTLKISGGSNIGEAIFVNPNNAVRMVVDERSTVKKTLVSDAVGDVTLTGNIGDLTVSTGKAPVKLLEASAGDVLLTSRFAEVNIDTKSKVDTIAVGKDAAASKVVMGGKASSMNIAAPEVDVSVKGTLDTLTYSSDGRDSVLSLDKGCKIKELHLDADKLDLSVSGDFSLISLAGEDCSVKFTSGATVARLDIEGDGSEVDVASGAYVKRVYIDADDIDVSGKGSVDKIQVDGGDYIAVSVPKASIYNKNGKHVTVGKITVGRGNTVTVSASGNSTEEQDKVETPTPSPTPTPTPPVPPVITPPTTPPPVPPVAVPSKIMNVSTATNASPSDFGFSGVYSAESFGSGFSISSELEGSSPAYVLRGTVKYMENFQGWGASGYYYPVVLDTEFFDAQKVSVMINDRAFGNELVSAGSSLFGKLIAYIPVQPDRLGEKIQLVFDADGESGKQWDPTTVYFNVSSLAFSGGDAHIQVYKSTVGAPGLDGAEAAAVSNLQVNDKSTHVEMSGALTTKSLLETKNTYGRFGYWVGVSIPAPGNASFASVKITTPGVKTPEESTLPVQSTDAGPRVILYFNAKAKSAGTSVTTEVVWNDTTQEPLPDVQKLIGTWNIANCKLAGEPGTVPPEMESPVVSGLTVALASDLDIAQYGKVTDYIAGGKMFENSVSGALLPAVSGKPEPVVEGKYYLPIKVTGEFAAAATIIDDRGNTLGTVNDTGSQSAILMAEVVAYRSAADVRLEVKAEGYATVKQVLDLSSVSAGPAHILFSEEAPPDNVSGKPVTYWVEDFEVQPGFSYVDLYGTCKKVTASEAGLEGTSAWAFPLTIEVAYNSSSDWQLVISASPLSKTITVEHDEFVSGKTTVLLPIGVDSTTAGIIRLQVLDSEGEAIANATVYTSNLELEGYGVE